MKPIKKIGVFTSGGDSPGMNACIRAVVRTALHNHIEVVGIMRGYEGMIHGEFVTLKSESVNNIIQRGGTILKTARSKAFMTPEGRQKAYHQLKTHGIDALVAIGGNGTFTGATIFEKEYGICAVGVPGTIDNDLSGTDFTLGFDTAINTAIHAIDSIRDTAESHDRLFFVEVMGRDSGEIALATGISAGADAVLLPEITTDTDALYVKLSQGRYKNSKIIVVAEGDQTGGAMAITEEVRKKYPKYDTRVAILGHIQRGGSPSCFDRILASELGFHAVEALLRGQRGVMAGRVNGKIVYTPFAECIKDDNKMDMERVRMANILA